MEKSRAKDIASYNETKRGRWRAGVSRIGIEWYPAYLWIVRDLLSKFSMPKMVILYLMAI